MSSRNFGGMTTRKSQRHSFAISKNGGVVESCCWLVRGGQTKLMWKEHERCMGYVSGKYVI